jgi:cell division protein FtsA
MMRHARMPRGAPSGKVVAALDIGSHKICCLIASHEPDYHGAEQASRMRVLGFSHQRSQGIDAGAVIDLASAEQAVCIAIAQAEQSAGIRVEEVHVATMCGAPASTTFNGQIDVRTGLVGAEEIAELDAGALTFAGRGGRSVLSLNRIAFGLDANSGVVEPRGLRGRVLWASHHAVTVEPGPLRNIGTLVERSLTSLDTVWPGAFTSALAATTVGEREQDVVVVDIGAGTTSIAGFAGGHFVYCDSLPLGGQHVTRDVARALGIPLAQAERIKTLYGSLVVGPSDAYELVSLDFDGQGEAHLPAVTRAWVGQLVSRRIEWMLSDIRVRIDACGVERIRGARVVLTGGLAQTMGLEAVAGALLGREAKVAGPQSGASLVGRLPGSVQSPAFSCVVGLALAAGRPSPWIGVSRAPAASRSGYLGRVERWLRESF